MRRGLTLIEVVAATVLFTMIVWACVPLLRHASIVAESASSPARGAQLAELEIAIDDLLRQRPGLIELVLEQPRGLRQTWNVGERAFAADARLESCVWARQEESRTSHAWVVFHAGDLQIARWLRTPLEQSEPENRQ